MGRFGVDAKLFEGCSAGLVTFLMCLRVCWFRRNISLFEGSQLCEVSCVLVDRVVPHLLWGLSLRWHDKGFRGGDLMVS